MNKILMLVGLLFSSSSFAYGNHASWSQNRGGMNLPYLFTTQSEVISSQLSITGTDQDSKQFNQSFSGLGFKTELGTEVFKFARFSTYHLYRDTAANEDQSLRGSEVGGEIKLSFYGPVLNIQFGLGINGSRLLYQNPTDSRYYYGTGYTGSVGFERFLASKASVLFTIKGQNESLRPEESAYKEDASISSVGGALGLILWLD